MNHLSTRCDANEHPFCATLLEGLAPYGGPYLPTHCPKIDDATPIAPTRSP